jgi:hypothetical protein
MPTKNKKNVPDRSGAIRGTPKNEWYGNPPQEKRFSSTRQPDKKKQLKGIQEFHFSRNAIKGFLNLKFHFPKNSKICRKLIEAFGPEIENANVGTIMIAVQVQKAIEKADTNAFNTLLNQAFGMPKMEVELPPDRTIIEVRHDDSEIVAGGKNGIRPVGEN